MGCDSLPFTEMPERVMSLDARSQKQFAFVFTPEANMQLPVRCKNSFSCIHGSFFSNQCNDRLTHFLLVLGIALEHQVSMVARVVKHGLVVFMQPAV